MDNLFHSDFSSVKTFSTDKVVTSHFPDELSDALVDDLQRQQLNKLISQSSTKE